jgi:hypothetical protein
LESILKILYIEAKWQVEKNILIEGMLQEYICLIAFLGGQRSKKKMA